MYDCPFCEEIADCKENPFKARGVKSRVIAETDEWLVIPSLGCLTVGYTLLVSKLHSLSASQLPLSALLELDGLIHRIVVTIERDLRMSWVLFEHGAKKSTIASPNSVDHAHLHIVPVYSSDAVWNRAKLWAKSNECCFEADFFPSAIDAFTRASVDPSDMYFVFGRRNRWSYVGHVDAFPKQFFRKLIAECLDAEVQWDWRRNAYEDNALKTLEVFAAGS